MKYLIALVLFFTASMVNAADVNCEGTVVFVMDYPTYCNGNTAFMTSGTNGKWVCPPSDKGDAIVLAALAAGKVVQVYIDSQNGAFSCSNLPNYVTARYVIIKP